MKKMFQMWGKNQKNLFTEEGSANIKLAESHALSSCLKPMISWNTQESL
jgi:hypothetical protein